MAKTEIGALAFVAEARRTRLVLVTTKTNQKWICPKGQPEKAVAPAELAAMEAYEEAGVTGTILTGISAEYISGSGKHIRLYPLRVEKILKNWPERRLRRRVVCTVKQALGLVSDDTLRNCIKELLTALRKCSIRA